MSLVSRLVPLSACALAFAIVTSGPFCLKSAAQAPAPGGAASDHTSAVAWPSGTHVDNHSLPVPTALETELRALDFPGWKNIEGYRCSVGSLPEGAPTPDVDGFDANKLSILREFRLNVLSHQSYQRGQRYIHVDLYDFKNSDGAYAAYCFLRRGASTVVKRGDATSEDDDSISFVQGKTFVSIYGTSADDDESKDVIRSIATQMAKSIPEHGSLPAVLNTLPQLELLHGSEKLVMGPLSARRFFPAPYLASLDYKNCKVACVADYQIQMPAKERVKMLVFDYGANGQAAQASYQSYLTELCHSKDEEPDQLFGRPSNQFKNGTTYTNIALKGGRVALISGARKRFSADLLLRQLH